MVNDGMFWVIVGVVMVSVVLGAMALAPTKPDEPEPVYGCVAVDDSKYLAYERHVFNKDPMLRARSTLNGEWYDVAIPKFTLQGCFTEPSLEMK